MNPLGSILDRARRLVTAGLERKPQDYLYLNRRALNEHYQAITGTARIPSGTRETTRATAGAKIPLINWGLEGELENSFELSDYHLFESLEPELRKLTALASAAGLEATLRDFVWVKGQLSWVRIGSQLFHVLRALDVDFMLLCKPDCFSPFASFFTENTELYKLRFEVEVLAYNPGILGQYGADSHPNSAKSLALVPTVIIVTDSARRAEIAAWIRKLNRGELSRAFRA